MGRLAARDVVHSIGLRRQRIVDAMAAGGRSVLTLIRRGAGQTPGLVRIGNLVEDLLSHHGESGGHRIAGELFACYRMLSDQDRIAFLNLVANGYGPDPRSLDAAVEAYRREPTGKTIAALRAATDSPRQVFIRRLNLAENGTQEIVRLREDALAHRRQIANFDALDADLCHVITPWFNIGFLTLQRMEWSSPANVLHKIIGYEAVHEVKGWDDLRRRVEPADRRCFAFFHPRMPDEPLIFVEVALTREIPADIASVLDDQRIPIPADEATVAVFYSISNCQEGLRGIPFGNTLIKRVVELLSAQLPRLKTFVTLSPVPGFAAWLTHQIEIRSTFVPAEERAVLETLGPGWTPDDAGPEARAALMSVAARYFLEARNAEGKAANAVARFHLGNGALLERINFGGDLSRNGLRDAYGLMVNYLYDSTRIEANAQRFADHGQIAASAEVRRLLKT